MSWFLTSVICKNPAKNALIRIHHTKDQREGKLPIFDPIKFVELIESRDIKLRGFFDTLFQSMNPAQKNLAMQQMLKQKVMILCYQMAALRNKQVSGTKTAIGLLMVGLG